MLNNTLNNIFWTVHNTYSIKRLNISDGSPVNRTVFENINFIGQINFNDMKFMFDDDEWKSLQWKWEHQMSQPNENVLLFKIPIKHHLRRGARDSVHYEVWILALIGTLDNTWHLCPIKRDSDFNCNIFQVLDNMTNIEKNIPWKTKLNYI